MTAIAHASAPVATRSSRSLLERLVAFGERASSANRCRLEAERLSALSDAELARLGLKRDEIVTHAFRRYLYI